MRSTGFITAAVLILGAAATAGAQSNAAPAQPLRPAAPRNAPARAITVRPAKPQAPRQPTVAQQLAESKQHLLHALTIHDNARVSLDVQDLLVTDALKQALQSAGKEFILDPDLPAERRVTLKAQDVKLSTALDLITQSAGAGWRVELRDGKPTYRVGKSMRTAFGTVGLNFSEIRPETLREQLLNVPEITRQFIPHVNNLYLFGADEERSTFHCPHCKGQTTMIRQRQQPKCTKCSRVFQKDWQFCPADGSKRPAAPSQWKFCPHCGKEVKPEKAAIRLTPPTVPDADAVEIEVRRF